jgi:hypothetical protein
MPRQPYGRPAIRGGGDVICAATMERYAREAGFSAFTVLPMEHAQSRFYRLDP